MLVLSRHVGEEIRIGDDIRIFVSVIQGDRVKLAIDAPKHKRIMRTELQVGKKGEAEQ